MMRWVISKELIGVLTLLLVGAFGISTVSAVMISTPNVVQPGEKIELFLGNLDQGNNLHVVISGDTKVTTGKPGMSDNGNLAPGDKFSIIIRDFYPEISTTDSKLSVGLKNLVPRSTAKLWAQNSTTSASDSDIVDSDGTADLILESSYTPLDTYNFVINGTSNSPDIPLSIDYSGTVGPNPPPLSICSFSIVGISNAVFEVAAYIDGEVTEQKSVTVQESSLASDSAS